MSFEHSQVFPNLLKLLIGLHRRQKISLKVKKRTEYKIFGFVGGLSREVASNHLLSLAFYYPCLQVVGSFLHSTSVIAVTNPSCCFNDNLPCPLLFSLLTKHYLLSAL